MPDKSALEAPALWSPRICGYINIFDTAPAGFSSASLEIPSSLPILADRRLGDGRHLVISDRKAWHRLWLCTDRPDEPVANLIVRDGMVDLRREAAARFDCWLGGGAVSLSSGFLPSDFQAQRFTMMLDILDLLGSAVDREITTHEIARRIVYPRMAIACGSEWKSSSERRRVQRLIAQARSLMNGGYRALLTGSVGRQKLP